MIKSINQPWAISIDYQNRYGDLWYNLDFIFEDKISAENFKTDPMVCLIGNLHIAGLQIRMTYKDLILYAKEISTASMDAYESKLGKHSTFNVEIKGRAFIIKKHELSKLSQTINDALHTAVRSYELGLYL